MHNYIYLFYPIEIKLPKIDKIATVGTDRRNIINEESTMVNLNGEGMDGKWIIVLISNCIYSATPDRWGFDDVNCVVLQEYSYKDNEINITE